MSWDGILATSMPKLSHAPVRRLRRFLTTRGEAVFREMETTALRERVRTVQLGRPYVIALGGGAFLREENFELVSNHGVSVWLDCPLSTIERRVGAANHRPLARDPGELRSLFELRRGGYAKAHYRVELLDDDVRAAVAKGFGSPTLLEREQKTRPSNFSSRASGCRSRTSRSPPSEI